MTTHSIWLPLVYPATFRLKNSRNNHFGWVYERIPFLAPKIAPEDAPVAMRVAGRSEEVRFIRKVGDRLVEPLRDENREFVSPEDANLLGDPETFRFEFAGTPCEVDPWHTDHAREAYWIGTREDIEAGRWRYAPRRSTGFSKWVDDPRELALARLTRRLEGMCVIDGEVHVPVPEPLLTIGVDPTRNEIVLEHDAATTGASMVFHLPADAIEAARDAAGMLLERLEATRLQRLAERVPNAAPPVLGTEPRVRGSESEPVIVDRLDTFVDMGIHTITGNGAVLADLRNYARRSSFDTANLDVSIDQRTAALMAHIATRIDFASDTPPTIAPDQAMDFVMAAAALGRCEPAHAVWAGMRETVQGTFLAHMADHDLGGLKL